MAAPLALGGDDAAVFLVDHLVARVGLSVRACVVALALGARHTQFTLVGKAGLAALQQAVVRIFVAVRRCEVDLAREVDA